MGSGARLRSDGCKTFAIDHDAYSHTINLEEGHRASSSHRGRLVRSLLFPFAVFSAFRRLAFLQRLKSSVESLDDVYAIRFMNSMLSISYYSSSTLLLEPRTHLRRLCTGIHLHNEAKKSRIEVVVAATRKCVQNWRRSLPYGSCGASIQMRKYRIALVGGLLEGARSIIFSASSPLGGTRLRLLTVFSSDEPMICEEAPVTERTFTSSRLMTTSSCIHLYVNDSITRRGR